MNRSSPAASKKAEMLTDKRSYEPAFGTTQGGPKIDINQTNTVTEPGFDPGQERDLGHSEPPKAQTLEKQDIEKQDNLLSTSEAAAAIGLSKSEFKRRELKGIYVATHVNRNGYHFYSLDYLSTLPGYGNQPKRYVGRIKARTKGVQVIQALKNETRRQEAAAIASPGTESEIASKIFQALDSGMSSREIVVKMLIHPNVVCKTYEAWLALGSMEGGGFQLSAKTLEAINNLPLGFGTYPVQNEAQLLANLQEACADTTMCTLCKQHPRKYCMPCIEKMNSDIASTTPAQVNNKRTAGRPRKSA